MRRCFENNTNFLNKKKVEKYFSSLIFLISFILIFFSLKNIKKITLKKTSFNCYLAWEIFNVIALWHPIFKLDKIPLSNIWLKENADSLLPFYSEILKNRPPIVALIRLSHRYYGSVSPTKWKTSGHLLSKKCHLLSLIDKLRMCSAATHLIHIVIKRWT